MEKEMNNGNDAKLYALSIFTKAMVEKRGWASQEDLDTFFEAGYDESHVLGVVTGIAVKTLSNYSNHLTQPEIDDAFAERKWSK
jgi:alkylhydroperoxidase family enzyme